MWEMLLKSGDGVCRSYKNNKNKNKNCVYLPAKS